MGDGAGGGLLPEDKGQAPDQKTAIGVSDDAEYETGGLQNPEVSPDFR